MSELLNIVSDNDEIIGVASRIEIHEHGLRHREIHVCFLTPGGDVIFQHRSKDKDTFPNLLDITVGGHVEIGASYEDTALKECEEETGLKLKLKDLIPIAKVKRGAEDKVTGKINNVFNARYLYIYKGRVEDLKVEAGEAIGFEVWPLAKLQFLSESDRVKFIPYCLEFISCELPAINKALNIYD